MVKEVHVTESGANLTLRLYSITELIEIPYLRRYLSNKQLKDWNPVYYKRYRNSNKSSKLLGTYLMKLFFDAVIDKLMDSDRVILSGWLGSIAPKELYIGEVQKSSKSYLNLHTDGKVYSIISTGFKLPIQMKLNVKRKQELKNRLLQGQPFY